MKSDREQSSRAEKSGRNGRVKLSYAAGAGLAISGMKLTNPDKYEFSEVVATLCFPVTLQVE